jgi:co-chaperonin GroES (HSP10)
MHQMDNNLSFIQSNEEQEAKDFIEKHLGFPPPRMAGYHMAVKIYIREEDVHQVKDEEGKPVIGSNGKPIYIALPDSTRVNDKFRNCTALVVSMGPEAYKGERFKESGPWCKVGDWVVIPRNEGVQVNYRGIPMQFIPDDRVLAIVEDPTYVTRD